MSYGHRERIKITKAIGSGSARVNQFIPNLITNTNTKRNATEHYLHKQLGNDGCWNDLPPTRMKKFICEIPITY